MGHSPQSCRGTTTLRGAPPLVKQVLLSLGDVQGDLIRLHGSPFHHLIHVRRVTPGEEITVLIPGKFRAQAKIRNIEANQAYLQILNKEALQENHVAYRVILSWLKGKKLEEVVRKLTELGTDEIYSFPAEHSVGLPGDRIDKKRQRWETIVREAAEQSGADRLPTLHTFPDLQSLLGAMEPSDRKIVFHQTPLEKPSLHGYLSGYYRTVSLAIGPEGGFSPYEIEVLRQAGWVPQTLPTPVLRAETAAVAALTAVKVLTEEKAFWKTHDSPS
jgi:16S rRNA (uracil1498-N3)-methyltransferase